MAAWFARQATNLSSEKTQRARAQGCAAALSNMHRFRYTTVADLVEHYPYKKVESAP